MDLPDPDSAEITLLIFRRTTGRLVADLTPCLLDADRRRLLPAAVVAQARAARLTRIHRPDEARYLCARAVVETLTAGLFYRSIAGHHRLGPILRGTTPATPAELSARVTGSLAEAGRLTGDHETIFGLSAAARWALNVDDPPILEQWRHLFSALDHITFDTVTGDIIGEVFERLINPERRRAMGQHYTQGRLARAVTRWVVDGPDLVVADVSCGAGTFLVEAYRRLRRMGRTHPCALRQVLGNDLDPFAVHLATINLATRDPYKGRNYPAVRAGDAFDLAGGLPLVDVTPRDHPPYRVDFPACGVDACVGNPPYDDKAADPQALRAALIRLGGPDAVPAGMRNGNLAAWYFLLAAALTRPSGGIALVVPAGLLQNERLLPFRAWLRSRYDITVWHSDCDVWFSDARVASIVLFARRKAGAGALGTATFVEIRQPVSGDTPHPPADARPGPTAVPGTPWAPAAPETAAVPGTAAAPDSPAAPEDAAAPRVAATPGTAATPEDAAPPEDAEAPRAAAAAGVPAAGVPVPAEACEVRDLSHLPVEADLLVAGTRPAALSVYGELPNTRALADLDGFTVLSGNKLGHEAYKLVDLDPGSERAVRRVRSCGLVLGLPKTYLTPLLSGPRDVRTGEFDDRHPRAWVLSAPVDLPSGGELERYVRDLRRLGVDRQPSVALRGAAWWSVDWRVANIAIQIHPGFEHQVWWADDPFVANNNFHVVVTRPGVDPGDRELVAASMASAFGALCALYVSAEVGCEGVRWLRTGHLAQWLVLDPASVGAGHRDGVLAAYRKYRVRDAQKIHAMSPQAELDWLALSTAVARAAGAADPDRLASGAVAAAKETTRRRAAREQAALAGRSRGGNLGTPS